MDRPAPDRPTALKEALTGAAGLSARTEAVLKFGVLGGSRNAPESNAFDDTYEHRLRVFNRAGALEPEYPPEAMEVIYHHSTALQPCVSAYEVNVDGFGFKLVPKVDLSKDDADQKIADQMYLERRRLKRIHSVDPDFQAMAEFPTPTEVAERRARVEFEMRLERLTLEQFFMTACIGMSYIRMRRHLRHDYCITGNSYMEAIRNDDRLRLPQGEVERFRYLPSRTMRLTRPDARPTVVESPRAISLFTWEGVPERRCFRRYVQIDRERVRWFKEFGDPRTISCEDGKPYASADKMPRGHRPATEVVHFRTVGPGPYGRPIWAGSLIELLGSRAAAEGNYLFFDNGTVAAGLLLVSGPGQIPQDKVKRVEDQIRTEISGNRGWGKWLIMQAQPHGGETAGVKITPLRLTQESIMDALWQNYDEKNSEKCGQQFRLPPQLRGKLTDANRSNSDVATAVTEEQVFQPERELFDADMDRVLMDMGVRYHAHRSNAPSMRNPAEVINNVVRAGAAGAMVVNEMRKELSLVLNFDLPPIKEQWGRLPLPLALAEKQNLGNLLMADAGGQDVGGMGGVAAETVTDGTVSPAPAASPPAAPTSEALKRAIREAIAAPAARAGLSLGRNGFHPEGEPDA